MSERASRRASPRAVLALLASALIVVAVAGYVLFAPGSKAGNSPLVAPSSLAGGFHPIAGSFKPDDTDLASCKDSDYQCLEQGFGNIAYRDGPKAALALFARRIEGVNGVSSDCHRIAHSIGSASFARFHGNVGKTFSLGSSICASGYYHGVLERAFVGVTNKAGLISVARRLCHAPGIRTRSYLDYQCEHGLGHGLMIESGYNLPLALSVCHQLATGWADVSCKGGVFMENINTSYGFRSLWVNEKDPVDPCGRVAVRDRRACYNRVPARAFELNRHDYAATATTCSRVDQLDWRQSCLRGYGRDVAVDSRFVPKTILTRCGLAGAGTSDCLYGAARTIGDTYGWAGAKRAVLLCSSAPHGARAQCSAGYGVVIGLLYPTNAARARACERVAVEYARACLMSAIAEVDPSGRESWG